MKIFNLVVLFLFILILPSKAENIISYDNNSNIIIKNSKNFELKFKSEKEISGIKLIDENFNEEVQIVGIQNIKSAKFDKGILIIKNPIFENNKIEIINKDKRFNFDFNIINGILTLFPPLIAILLALITKNVLVSIFLAIFSGSLIINEFNIFTGFIRIFDHYLINSLSDYSHICVILFSVFLGGMIGVIVSSGSINTLINKIIKYANTRKKTLFITWFIGVILFFDDYASALLNGVSIRSFTDKMKISREKLCFVVDSLSASLAGLIPLSTWVGFQLGQIEAGMNLSQGVKYSSYDILIASIPYNFYCIFIVFFSLIIVLSGKDYSLMLKAELRAIKENKVFADNSKPMIDENLMSSISKNSSIYISILPIFILCLGIFFGLIYSGMTNMGLYYSDISFNNLKDIIANASTSHVLLWAASIATFTTIILSSLDKNIGLDKTLEYWLNGIKSIIFALIILNQAWLLSNICSDLNTNIYMTNLLGNNIPLWIYPIIVFLITSFTSFATGTSFGTMGIMFPLVTPLIVSVLINNQIDIVSNGSYNYIFISVIAAVFSGAIFGDNCSPTSDTTLLSSISSASDLIDHVKTQLPYGITVLIISSFSFILASFNINPWFIIILGFILIIITVNIFGKKAEVL